MSNKIVLKASKFSGLGNKILLIDLIRQSGNINSVSVKKVVEENQVEFDQLISIEAPIFPDLDFSARIFNKDGSQAENCINGARCFAKYVIDSDLLNKEELLVGVGEIRWRILAHQRGDYSVEQEISDIFIGKDLLPEPNINNLYELAVVEDTIEIGYINLGNPHGIFFTSGINDLPLEAWGESLQTSSWFPGGVNFGLAEINSPSKVNLRVYERGVGETLSCGSGACATVILGIQLGLLQEEVEVIFKKGSLFVKYNEESRKLTARGTANFLKEINVSL